MRRHAAALIAHSLPHHPAHPPCPLTLPLWPAAPFLMSGTQFLFQHLIARAVLALGWVKRKSDGSQSWHDYLRKGVRLAAVSWLLLAAMLRVAAMAQLVAGRSKTHWLLSLASAAPALPPSCRLCTTTAPHLLAVVPNGVATGLDIGLSNYSLVFITLSFYVMCKSTTPLFLLFFAIAWGIEKPSWCGGGAASGAAGAPGC